MEYAGTLLTIAELAVALAGFASLVSVIARSRNNRSRAIDAFRLHTMLEMALRNAAFALAPLPFLQMLPSDPIVWRVASGLYMISTALYMVRARMRARSLEGVASEPWILVSTLSIASISFVMNFTNVVGLGGSNAFSIYLGVLVLGLVTTGVLFLSVAASVFSEPGS